MGNDVVIKLTFDNEEIAEFIEKLARHSLSEEEEFKLCMENEEEFNQWLKEAPEEYNQYEDFIYKKYYEIVTMEGYLRQFFIFDYFTIFYRKDNCIWICNEWASNYELIENISKLLNVNIIADVDENLSDEYDAEHREFYKII